MACETSISEGDGGPLLSIVIPFYNAERYLEETVLSVLAQSFQDYELLLIDDCSTDGSAECIQRYLSDRVRYHRQAENNGGPSAPRNAGIRLSRGKFVALFDADDLMLPGKLAVSAFQLARNCDVGLLCTNFRSIDANGNITKADFLSDYRDFRGSLQRVGDDAYRLSARAAYTSLLGGNFIGTSSVVVPREVFEKVGTFDETLSNGDDYDLWLRITRQFDILFIDRIYHAYRVASGSISSRGHLNALNRIKVLEKQLSLSLDDECSKRLGARLRINYQQCGDAERRRGNLTEARRLLKKSLSHGFSWLAVKGLAATFLQWPGGSSQPRRR